MAHYQYLLIVIPAKYNLKTTPSGGLFLGVPGAIPRLSARCSLTPLAAWSAALRGR